MPRRKRQKSVTDFYHIIVRGIAREDLFETDRNKQIMMKYMKEKLFEGIEIYAFCIMRNHLHLLIHAELKDISKYMHAVETSYALYYNRKKERVGYVFQNRFKSFPIEDEAYLWACLHYIHLNPVKAKMVTETQKYLYSSAREYILGRKGLVHPEAVKYYKKEKFLYPVEKVERNLKTTFIGDLDDEEEEQKEKLFLKWIESYLEENPFLKLWDIKHLAVERRKFAETVLDLNVMSERELFKRLEEFQK